MEGGAWEPDGVLPGYCPLLGRFSDPEGIDDGPGWGCCCDAPAW